MPFQPINFANIAPIGAPAARNFIESLVKGFQAAKMPQQMERQAQSEELLNALNNLKRQGAQLELQQAPQRFESQMSNEAVQRAFQQANAKRMESMTPLELQQMQLQNEFYPKNTQSQIDSREAQTNLLKQLTPLQVQELFLKNKFYPSDMQSQVDSRKALADMRALGGAGLGAGGREEMLFQQLVAKDNPQLTPEQVYEASNVLRMGGDKLANGTSIKDLSPAARSSFDRLVKYGTTNPLITQGKGAQQAEKEIDVLGRYIMQAVAPYGDTLAGYSPKQIIDTFSPKKEDQIALGRLAASQQLQTDLAAIQNKLNSGQSTATITNEILDRSEMMLKTKWPRMSNTARQEAMRYLNEALKEGLKARESVPLGASTFQNPNKGHSQETQGQPPKRVRFNPATGGFE